MQTLVVQLTVSPRSGPLTFVRVDDAGRPGESGAVQPSLLPRGPRRVGVWPAEMLSLFAVALPELGAQRLQAALVGSLEERVLGELGALHLAAGPRGADGGTTLACCCDRAPLAAALRLLEDAGQEPDAVVPEPALIEPGDLWLRRDGDSLRAVWRDAAGESAWLRLQPGAAPPLPQPPRRVLAAPALAAEARALFGDAIAIEPVDDETILARAARPGWNLRQFELAPRAGLHRAASAVREGLRTPAWRRVIALAVTLGVIELIGIEFTAMQLRARRAALAASIDALVAQALPGEPAVLDPGLRMDRALDLARRHAGRPTRASLEVLLGAAARALPDHPTVSQLRYQPGRLTLRVGAAAAAAALPRCPALGVECSAKGDDLMLETAE